VFVLGHVWETGEEEWGWDEIRGEKVRNLSKNLREFL